MQLEGKKRIFRYSWWVIFSLEKNTWDKVGPGGKMVNKREAC